MNEISPQAATEVRYPFVWDRIVSVADKTARGLSVVSGVFLAFVMFLSVADIAGRAMGHPIMGTYEVVGLCGALIIGFSIPYCSSKRGHIYMEFLLEKLSPFAKWVVNTATRIVAIILFGIIGVNLFRVAAGFYLVGEVTSTVRLPIYPLFYALGSCCFLECLVFVCDIVKIWEGKYE